MTPAALPAATVSAVAAAGHTSQIRLLAVFVLAVFLGLEVISKVSSTLHTPLMSGSNAIHGVIMVGAIVALGSAHSLPGKVIGVSALILATVNAVGGFVVTDRMLGMFRRRRGRGGAHDGQRADARTDNSGAGERR
jgi:proton-translocating NAD(P)+ transhydrogenase subunit alpha